MKKLLSLLFAPLFVYPVKSFAAGRSLKLQPVKSFLKTLFVVVILSNGANYAFAQTLMDVGPQTGTNIGNTRGYWFTAPTDFVITGLRVPTDASVLDQNIQVVKFNSIPPVFATVTNNFTTLALFQNVSGASIISVSIVIQAGDIIGILGVRGTVNSYGTNPYSTSIAGFPVTLTRLGFQDQLQTIAAYDVWQEPGGTSISRVEMYYVIPQSCQSITTTFAGPTATFDGNMFDIVALNDMIITGFDGNILAGTATVEIYYKTGSYQGYEGNPGAWARIDSVGGIVTNGAGVATPIPIVVNIPVKAGDTVAFYITTTGSPNIEYSTGTLEGSVYVSDANLQLLEGNGNTYPFGFPPAVPRVWNGTVYYQVQGIDEFTPQTLTVGSIGGAGGDGGSDFYGQSFIADIDTITMAGVWLEEIVAEGEVIIAIAPDDGLGNPDETAVLWQSALINPEPVGRWFVLSGLSIPVTVGTKYWVLLDGMNPGATGTARAGKSNVAGDTTDTGENLKYSNDGGVSWTLYGSGRLSVFVGGSCIPTLPDDVGVIAIDAPTSGCGLTATELVTVRVKNFGSAAQSAIPVSFDDGTGAITEIIAGPLNPGDTITYNFTATSDLSVPGTYTFDAWTSLAGDVNNGNDSIINYTVDNSLLTTTFAGGNSQDGNMFDIVAINNVTITGFDAHPISNDTIEIYYRTGSYLGFQTTSAGWNFVGKAYVTANPFGTPTPVPILVNVPILAGDTVGFYVTNQSANLNYTDGTVQGAVFASDANIQFLEGHGGTYPFNLINVPRVFNGIVYYNCAAVLTDDVGVIAIDAPTSGCGLTATELVTVRVKNFGSAAQSAIPVSFDDGTGAVTETIAGPLNPGDTIPYTFAATSALSVPGTYTFNAWTGLVGDVDNSNDSSFATVESVIIPAAPTANNASSCADDSILLSVAGTADGFFWYDSLTGGSLVAAGNTFYTPYLSTTTDYYVEGVNLGGLVNIGPVDNTIGTGANYTTNDAYLIIDVLQPVVLKSARFYAAGAGNRIFEVRDASNSILGNVTVFVPDGESVVNIGLNLPVGNNLRLGLNSNSNTDLYRNDSGTAYPYTASGLMSITNTSAGTGYYYFYYDMTIATMSCQSARTQVTATINSCADVSVIAIDAPISGCGLTVGESVTVRVKNLGSDTVSTVPVSYRINGGAPVIEVIVPAILPGDTSAYTFTTTADLSVTGTYIFDAWTNLAGDIDNANDSTTNYTVDNITAPTVDLGPDATACDSIILDAGNPGATYLWSTAEITQTITAAVSDTYFVEVTLPGCTPVYDTINVTVNPSPIVDLGSDTTVCIGILLDVTTGGATYYWSDASTNPTLSVSTSGTYWVDVTVGGCTTRDSIDVIINSGPPVVNLGSDTTICGGIVLDGGANPGATFAWSTGDTTQTIFVSISGTYSVDVTNACTNVSDSVTITVIPVPVVDLGNDTIVCVGDTVILDATTTGVTYSWSTGDTIPTITVNTTGTYSVVLTDTATGCTANDTIIVTVSTGPTAFFIFTTAGLSVTFTNTSLEASSYFWDYGDGIGTSTMTSETYIYATAGTYDVTLVAINPCGSDTIKIPVTVTTGIAENNIATEQINVYPNPNEGVFTISFTGFKNEKVQLAIIDMQGRRVIEEQLTVNNELNKILDISSFSKGMYFLRVITSYNVLTRKILVE